MTFMFSALALLFIAVAATDVFIATCAVRIVRKYTLPGWTAARLVVPAFILASLALFAFAAYFLFEIRSLAGAPGGIPITDIFLR